MKYIFALCFLCLAADARLLGSLSLLPDLAFFYGTEKNSLYDVFVNETVVDFLKIADVKKNQFFDTSKVLFAFQCKKQLFVRVPGTQTKHFSNKI